MEQKLYEDLRDPSYAAKYVNEAPPENGKRLLNRQRL
jgi:hypothetical protein